MIETICLILFCLGLWIALDWACGPDPNEHYDP